MAAKSRTSDRQSRAESPDAQELLTMELQQIHSAETQLSRVLPRLSKAVQSDKLQSLLGQRQEEGERLIQGVEAALDELGDSPGRRRNVAAEGLINDAREHVQEIEDGPALDAVLIAAIQKTEHYCIAAWGTARALAETAGQKTTVKAMKRALKEGKSLDEKLTKLAESEINPQLQAGASEEEDEDEDEDEDDDEEDEAELEDEEEVEEEEEDDEDEDEDDEESDEDEEEESGRRNSRRKRE
jgi:ferritin-like metal-binding protein YciE